MLNLAAQQSVTLTVPEQSVPIHHYLRQPRRLVNALMNPAQVTDLGDGVFRLQVRAFRFLMLHIEPVVDLRLQVKENGRIRLRSVGCEIRGNRFIDQHFELNLKGFLQPIPGPSQTTLEGVADLAIAVDLPPVLQLTPRPLLETTGNQLLKGILLTLKQRLSRQLVADYQRWSREQQRDMEPARAGAAVSPQTPQ
jgi:hypothetical protein